jgi:hypothetical protein
MQLTCSRCHHILEFSGQRPSFCAYCGQGLSDTLSAPTAEWAPEAATLVPQQPEAAEASAVPERVGSYRIIRPIGAGGMGTVYEAEDESTGRRVALKLLSSQFALSRSSVERFRQEGRLASAIAHPRCVFVLAADEEAGRPYIVMELMSGSTLQDLVRKEGPLPPEQAIAKILDVIEGLQEAHRLGVIHRDVKPSNCFLQSDGRVKVGDFGLAKSLVSATHLIKTGTFLGTVLFASPEQIRHDPLDEQTDVYSVAATLYYLLIGQAPFQSADAAATLARIVSDAAPAMRSLRPEISAALDKVVLRGLERERARRWRSLDTFREALVSFLPHRISIEGMGIRFGAYLIDYFFVWVPLSLLPFGISSWDYVGRDQLAGLRPGNVFPVAVLLLLYFTVTEGLWGCSLGKWMLGLRVVREVGAERPGLARALFRTSAFYALLMWGVFLGTALAFVYVPPDLSRQEIEQRSTEIVMLGFLPMFGSIVGVALVLLPMRARNGYRGLHEFVSGTRVIRLPWPERRRVVWGRAFNPTLTQAPGIPERLGAYSIHGAVRSNGGEKILLSEDKALQRKVWIWVRPGVEPALAAIRKETGRSSRARWLACGTHENMQWDAFVFRAGCPLRDLVAGEGKLCWSDARHCLGQLAEELAAASSDGTLPATLGVDQLWVQPNGGLQLLDWSLGSSKRQGTEPIPTQDKSAASAGTAARADAGALASVPPVDDADDKPALRLLQQASVYLLEGRDRAPDDTSNTIRAPLPGYAAKLLSRLLNPQCGYTRLREFQADLSAAADEPTEVNRSRRAAHVAVLTAFLSCGLGWMVMALFFTQLFSFAFFAGMAAQKKQVVVLRSDSVRDFVSCLFSPSPIVRVGGVHQLACDIHLGDRVAETLDHFDRKKEAIRDSSLSSRGLMLAVEANLDEQISNAEDRQRMSWETNSLGRLHFRTIAESVAEGREVAQIVRVAKYLLLLGLVFWPLAWVIWAFLFRGGFSYRIVDIALVRGNGRPASRMQCAWRALLVWAPVTALLALSFWLNFSYWEAWQPNRTRYLWMLWVSSAFWWSALLLLLGYIGLALLHPSRTLHDRLAGTYLVPR